MPSPLRLKRIGDRFRKELSEMLVKEEIRDPRLSGVTITEVKVDRELSYAEIYVSAFEGVTRSKEILEKLERASGYIRKSLSERIELRSFPKLRFHWDETPERADRIEQLLASIRSEVTKHPASLTRPQARALARCVPLADVAIGDSIAVSGCCLTVVSVERGGGTARLAFDVSAETLACTNGLAAPGEVNLEKALRLADLDGLYQEEAGQRPTLTIIGGGHVGLALSRVMADLDFHIVVLDDRAAVATMTANTHAQEKQLVRYTSVGRHVREGLHSYVVIMTSGHQDDERVLRQLAGRKLRYLGLMGSPAKIRQIFSSLGKKGVSAASLKKVHAPVGLPIHSHTPEEIAISIAAEIIQTKNQP